MARKKKEVEETLPVNETQDGVQQEEGRGEEEVEETVRVFNKNKRLMRTFTGKGARKQAEALASQERRDGWTVV